MAEGNLENVQRWTARRWSALVLQIMTGETSAPEAARKHGLTVAEVEGWRDRFLSGAGHALRSRPKDEEALKDDEIKRLKQKVGELVLDNDTLREAAKPYRREDIGRVKAVAGRGPRGSPGIGCPRFACVRLREPRT